MMTAIELPANWASRFGLALSPLFEARETEIEGSHHVLLDGGYGSFAMSVANEQIWRDLEPASWSWSSNLPHHVTITDREVAVLRWDNPVAEVLTRRSVESQMEAFYSYLTADRVKSNQRVVDQMLIIFKRIRSLVADARIDDHKSIDAYLAFLEVVAARSANPVQPSHGFLFSAGEEILAALSSSAVEALYEDVAAKARPSTPLRLYPELAIRHAGSEIFQEAHFELLSVPSPDLFGYAAPAESRHTTRGGAHFTPPALARSIVEQALAQIPDCADRDQLVIFDPACGSGAFLHEAARSLRRIGFDGQLVMIGRDTSAPAVSMARFVLEKAKADWTPKGGYTINIEIGDSLVDRLPSADFILMNPPFVAWSALTTIQREQMRDILGQKLTGRGDFSMAFVTRAIEALKPGGVVGTLLPGSLLTLQAAEGWRNDLLDQADLCFVASLGDYGLFAYALVQVAATVFRKRYPNEKQGENVTALITGNNADATGDAFRTLRRRSGAEVEAVEKSDWRLFKTSASRLRDRATWRLISPRTETAIKRMIDIGGAVPIGSLFDVRQGVRTGANPVFLLSEAQVRALPLDEQIWFRPAIMNDGIQSGSIDAKDYVFYPYNSDGLVFADEGHLSEAVPQYYGMYLKPQKSRLEKRASISRGSRKDWWGLSERRVWALSKEPRIVSKYFGGVGGFATDLNAENIVVQGFAWFPKWVVGDDSNDDELSIEEIDIRNLLSAYAALMNSSVFSRVLEIFSPHVAGGQYDLSPRYVNSIPVPNFSVLATDERAGKAITRLARLGYNARTDDTDWRSVVDRLTTELYGSEFIAQI